MKEIFKSVVGYEGIYSVSNFGNVRRDKKSRGAQSGKMLKTTLSNSGYFFVGLYNGIIYSRHHYVHKLVCQAFIGYGLEGYDINHIDGNKINNRSDNLEYLTRSENQKHSFKIGLNKKGEDHHSCKLTEKDVLKIRNLGQLGISYINISKKFKVAQSNIHFIIKRKTWKHI